MPADNHEKVLLEYIEANKITNDRYQELEKLRIKLENIMQEGGLSDFNLQSYGSITQGLGLTDHDLDLYIHFLKKTRDVGRTLSKLGRILLRNNNLSSVHVIKKASVPIVKCYATNEKVSVDLQCTSPYGVENSRMIKAYCDCHPLVKPFLLATKLWMKQEGISGNFCFPSYSFALMGLFTLMRGTTQLIRPFKEVQRMSEDTVTGTNYCTSSFAREDVTAPIDNTGNISLMQLLLEFFLFYSIVDFTEFFISPYEGDLMWVDDFGYEDLEIKDMCVQDPMQLSVNKTREIKTNSIQSFQNSCMEASKDKKYTIDKLTLSWRSERSTA